MLIAATCVVLATFQFFWSRKWYTATKRIWKCVESGDLGGAEEHLAVAWKTVFKLSASDPRRLIVMLEDARLSSLRGRYDESVALIKAVLAECDATKGIYRNTISRALLNLAEVIALAGNAEEAERRFIESNDFRERNYGTHSQDLALSLNRYADFLAEHQRLEEAKSVSERAQRIIDRTGG